MIFVEKYISSVNSCNLMDDDHHHSAEALIASALADITGSGLGSLLYRVKYTDGTQSKLFESGSANLASLLRIWINVVTEKGRSRGWMPTRNAWDVSAAYALYKRVAEMSLAHWIDGRCVPCNGAGVMSINKTCTCCAGSGKSQIQAGRFESDKILDMVSELEGLTNSHNLRATKRMRNYA